MFERFIVFFEGVRVGEDPDVAAEVTRALVAEARKQGEQGKYRVRSLTLARDRLAIKLDLNAQELQNEEAYLRDARLVFRAVASAAYNRTRGFVN